MPGHVTSHDIASRAVQPEHEGVSVENAFAGALAAGTLVYVSTVNTTTGMRKVTKADADAAAPANVAVYVVIEAIAQSGFGRVARGAILRNQNTSAWTTAGDAAYLDVTAGVITPTAPTATNSNVQVVGFCVSKSATEGVILIDLRASPIKGASIAGLLSGNNAWTGTNDHTKAMTGTDELINSDVTMTHATQIAVPFDGDYTQLTNARTGGYGAAFRAKTTSLAGDLNGVPYAGYYVLAPTDGGGAVLHCGVYVEAGNDYSVFGQDNVRTAWGTGAAGVADATQGWDATNLTLLCAVDDSVYKIGNGTNSWDVWIYGNVAGDYLEWDASASLLAFRGAAAVSGLVQKTAGATAITTTRAVTRADSGGVFTLAQSSTYATTIAQPTSAGERYIFQLVSPGAFAPTIAATGCTFEGTITIDAATIPCTGSTITFASGSAVLGDSVEVISTSTTKFFVRAIASGAGGITIT